MPHNGEAEIFTGYCLPYVEGDGTIDHRDQLTLCRTVDVLLEMLFEFTNPGIRVSALLIEVNTLPATLVCTSPTLARRPRHESKMQPAIEYQMFQLLQSEVCKHKVCPRTEFHFRIG